VIVSECFSGVSWSREPETKNKKRRGHAGKNEKTRLPGLSREPARTLPLLTESIFELFPVISPWTGSTRGFSSRISSGPSGTTRARGSISKRRAEARRFPPGRFLRETAHPLVSLDDAAKIYPLSMKRNQMAVFRLSVYLRDNVVPDLLQIALTFTITRFPCFATPSRKDFSGTTWTPPNAGTRLNLRRRSRAAL
jgi:hypothetical protein